MLARTFIAFAVAVAVVFVTAALAPDARANGAVAAVGTGAVGGPLGPHAPKRAGVWLEGAPSGSWSAPRDVPVMSQRGARFAPDLMVVAVGQSVTMPNDDRLIHNVFSISPAKKFDLGHYPQGESRTVQFDKPGVVELFCNIHENMHATVVVAPSTFFAVADAEGKFALRGVPAGSYKLTAYSPDEGTATTTVKIAAGATTKASFQLEKK